MYGFISYIKNKTERVILPLYKTSVCPHLLIFAFPEENQEVRKNAKADKIAVLYEHAKNIVTHRNTIGVYDIMELMDRLNEEQLFIQI